MEKTAVTRYYEAAYELDDLRLYGSPSQIDSQDIKVRALAAEAREILAQERKELLKGIDDLQDTIKSMVLAQVEQR